VQINRVGSEGIITLSLPTHVAPVKSIQAFFIDYLDGTSGDATAIFSVEVTITST